MRVKNYYYNNNQAEVNLASGRLFVGVRHHKVAANIKPTEKQKSHTIRIHI